MAHDAYESALNARVPEADWRKKMQADELEAEIKEAIAKGRWGLWSCSTAGVEDDDLDLGPHQRDPFALATLATMAGSRGGGATHDQMLTMGDQDFRSRLVQGARVRDAIAQAVGLRGHTSLPLLLRGRRETDEQSFELGAKRLMTMIDAAGPGAPVGPPQSVLDPFFERQRKWFRRQGYRNRFGILANGKMVEADGTFADAVKGHKLVFLTGLAGTGKSTELLWQTLENWKKVFVIARQKGLQTELRRQERQDEFLRILSKKKTLQESCSVEKRRKDECRQRLLDMANRSTNHFLPQLRESTARAMGYEDESQAKAPAPQKDGSAPAPSSSTVDLVSPWVDCFLAFRTEMSQILSEVARKQAQAGATGGAGARAAGAGGLEDGLGGRDATSSPLLAAPSAEDEEGLASEDDKSEAPPLRRRGSLALVRATSFSDEHVVDAISRQSEGKIEKSTLAKTLLPNVVKIAVGSRKELEVRKDLSSTVLSVAEVQGLEFGVVLIFLPHLVEQQLQLQLQKGENTFSQGAGTRTKKATKQELGDWLAQLFIAFTRANSGIIVVGQNVSPSQQTPVFAEAGKPKHQHHSASTDKLLWGKPFPELLHGAAWPSPSSPTEGPGAAASTSAPPVLHILTEAQEKWESTLFTLLQGPGSPGTSALARELFGKYVLPRWKTSAARMRICGRGSAVNDTAMEVEDVGEDTVMEGADEEGSRPSQTAAKHQLTWGVDRVSGKRVTLDDVGQTAARFYSKHDRAANKIEVEDIGRKQQQVEENGAWVAFQLAVAAYEEKSSQAFRAKLPPELRAGVFRSMPSESEAAVLVQGHILQEAEYFLGAKDIEAVFFSATRKLCDVVVEDDLDVINRGSCDVIKIVYSLDELAQLAKVLQRSLEDLGPQDGRRRDGAEDDKDASVEDFGAVAPRDAYA
eukprot:g7771.t1